MRNYAPACMSGQDVKNLSNCKAVRDLLLQRQIFLSPHIYTIRLISKFRIRLLYNKITVKHFEHKSGMGLSSSAKRERRYNVSGSDASFRFPDTVTPAFQSHRRTPRSKALSALYNEKPLKDQVSLKTLGEISNLCSRKTKELEPHSPHRSSLLLPRQHHAP